MGRILDFIPIVTLRHIIETNTYYESDPYTSELHHKTLKVNGWTFCPVDIIDEQGITTLPVNGGKRITAVDAVKVYQALRRKEERTAKRKRNGLPTKNIYPG